jgi:anti-sigma factor RsiW
MSELRSLPRRDLRRLSSYLDGELSPKERARLEARLASDPRLQEALDELRDTVQLLRALPRVRAPRNFLLTREMVGVQETRAAYPFLRLATAVAMLAFLVTVGVDVLLPRTYGAVAPRSIAERQAVEPVQQAEPTEEAAGAETQEAAPLVLQAPSEEGRGEAEAGKLPPGEGALGTALTAQAAPEEAQADKIAATPQATQPGIGFATTESEAPQGLEPGQVSTPTGEATVPGGLETSRPLGGGVSPTSRPLPSPMETEQPGSSAPAPIRPLEIGLGVLAVALLGITLWARRKPK